MTNQGPRRLTRSHDRKIAGVAGGIAEYLDLDPTLVRLGFVVIAFLGLGAAAVGYVVLWVVMPDAESQGASSSAAEPPSTLLVVALVFALAIALAGGVAWVGVLSVQLLRISLPVWVVVIVGVYLIARSRRARPS